MAVYQLEKDNIYFPDPSNARADGLLAVGGDLSVKRLLLAYTNGIFPWFNPEDPILWWCPYERFVIKPKDIHISHSMKKYFRKHEIKIVFNRDFQDTMHRCRLKREFKEGTWITDQMEQAYYELYKAGYAASVEAYVDEQLAGGLYGVVIGRNFFGESMFSEMENGSKVALIGLAMRLEEENFGMIDCQFQTMHLESMGGEFISYADYMDILRQGLQNPPVNKSESNQ